MHTVKKRCWFIMHRWLPVYFVSDRRLDTGSSDIQLCEYSHRFSHLPAQGNRIKKNNWSSKKQIMAQFIIENTVLCFMALVIGYLLTLGFTLPGFNSIASASNPMILELDNPRLCCSLPAVHTDHHRICRVSGLFHIAIQTRANT